MHIQIEEEEEDEIGEVGGGGLEQGAAGGGARETFLRYTGQFVIGLNRQFIQHLIPLDERVSLKYTLLMFPHRLSLFVWLFSTVCS